MTVVTPLLCQSKPGTQPKARNRHGSNKDGLPALPFRMESW